MKKIIVGLLACMTMHLSGEIIETNEIETLTEKATKQSLVLCNITSTLYTSSNTCSDNLWRTYFAERVMAQATDSVAADAYINKVKNMIVNKISKKTVEPATSQVIANLQAQEIPVVGITRKNLSTAYEANFAELTSNHLKSVGIDLEKTQTYLKTSYPLAYGIIFTEKKTEGPAVISFLTTLEQKPTTIIMIDNEPESLKSVEDALANTNISFLGLRYGRTDYQEQNFNADIGTIEFLEYVMTGKILSDDEALQIKLSHPEIDYQALLDAYINKHVN